MKNNRFIYGMVFMMLCGLSLAAYKPFIEDDKAAFGELSVAEPTPVVQVQFPYNINPEIIELQDNFGTSTVSNNMATLTTGAFANRAASIQSIKALKYNAGQGALWRGSGLFTTGVDGSTQWIGIGDNGDGYFFGYQDTVFGIMRRQGGVPETRRFAISTGSSNADVITITLNGNPISVTVTDSSGEGAFGSRTVTANEIADADYSNVGRGWEAHSMGPNVFFRSYSDDARSGTYSLADEISMAGSFSQSLAGVTATEAFVAQTAWNHDRMLFSTDPGNSLSGMTLDQTKGNVFQIRYQWLGFGLLSWFVENEDTGKLVLVHHVHYANTFTIPSVNNPTLPLFGIVENGTSTASTVVQIGSMGGFIEGRNEVSGVPHSFGTQTASISGGEIPIFTLHSHDIYQGKVNRVGVDMLFGSVSVDGTKPVIVRVRKNPILVGASFNAHDSDTSTIHQDFQATSVTGGEIIFQETVAKDGTAIIPFKLLQTVLVQPDFLTLSLEPTSGSTDAASAVNWEEKF